MTMSARRTGALALATLIALTAAACDKGSKSGGGGKGMAGASAVAPKGGLKRALSMMPANSEMVIAIDFKQIRSSDLWKKYEGLVMGQVGKGLEEFKTVCGWDPIAKASGALAKLAWVGLTSGKLSDCVSPVM